MAIDHLLCTCGHRKFRHYKSDGMCDGFQSSGAECDCREFRLNLSVTTAEAKEIDPSIKGDFCVPSSENRVMSGDWEKARWEEAEATNPPNVISETPKEFGLKDSGQRQGFASGMVRDTDDTKPAFDLIIPKGIPYKELMLTRWAEQLRKGAIKYKRRNWELADSDEELERATASAFRHFMQWLSGETDEDHAAAVFFNITQVETIKYKQKQAIEMKENNGS